MNTNEEIITPQLNTQSVFSLIFGVLTILSLCIGLSPIPFTGFVCFPLSALLGILALIFGAISLNQIRKHNHSGHHFAWTGILIGGLVFMCMICMAVAIASLYIFVPNSIHIPPFIQNFQI